MLHPASESMFTGRMPEEQQTAQPISQATTNNMFSGVSQEGNIQMQQQQQQQQVIVAADTTTAAPVIASAPTPAPAQIEPPKDLESASPTKSQPVRKISRFLVSPAILTVTNEKSAQNICIEDPIKSPLTVINNSTTTQSPNFIQNMTNISPDKQIDPQNQVNFVERSFFYNKQLSIQENYQFFSSSSFFEHFIKQNKTNAE